MSAADDGGPAFPNAGTSDSELYAAYGMSLRDWFAGRALAALITDLPGQGDAESFAREAYEYADAMLRERAKAEGKAP